MVGIDVNDTIPRNQYTATAGQVTFTYNFLIKAQTDLKVYQRVAGSTPDDTADILIITVDYTVTGVGTETGGTIVLVTGATVGDILTIERDMPLERASVYNTQGVIGSVDLEDDMDRTVLMIQQNEMQDEVRNISYARSAIIAAKDRITPILGSLESWRMNEGETAIEAFTGATPGDIQDVYDDFASHVAGKGASLIGLQTPSTSNLQQWINTIGTIAIQDSDSVSITGGSIIGITDLAIVDGGTAASSAAHARINLGLQIGVDVQAYNDNLTDLANVSTVGLMSYTTNGIASRTITGTDDQINVTFGNGVSNNPLLAISDNPKIPGTAYMRVPRGTTAERPITPENGMIRYDTDKAVGQMYEDSEWHDLIGDSDGAPRDATYITQTHDDGLSNEQALGDLNTGILKSTAVTGVVSIAVNGTDYISALAFDSSPQLSIALDANSKKINNLADPTAAQDAVTKSYADGLASSHYWQRNVTTLSPLTAGDNVDIGTGTLTTTKLNASTGLVKTSAGTISYITDSSTNWDSAYTKRVDTWTAPLGFAGNTASITQAGAAADGYLSSTDWNTFNNKHPDITWGDGLQFSAGTASVDYNTTNLKITATKLNTVQDIAVASAPEFDDVTITGLSGDIITSSSVETSIEELDSYVYNMGLDSENLTGFVNRTDSTISWSDTTPDRTLTISPVSGSFEFYELGVKYTKSGSETHQIGTDEGLHIIYYSGGSLTSIANPTDAEIVTAIETKALVAYVYWDATNSLGELFEERHGINMSSNTHSYLHFTFGTRWFSGLALGDFVIGDGSSNTHAQFSIATGKILDEDITNTTNTLAYTVGAEVWYLDGTDWRKTTNAGYSVLTTGTGRLAYNNSGAQTEVGDNDYVLCHIFGWNATDGNPISIQGQATYDKLKDAREGAQTEISNLILSGLPGPEMKPVGTVIFNTKDTFGNAVKARVVQTDLGDNYVDFRYDPLSPAQPATDHGSLVGLENDDHDGHPWLLGRSGGQVQIGGTDASDDLTLQSTSNATKGLINLGTASAYSELEDSMILGGTTAAVTINGTAHTSKMATIQDTTANADNLALIRNSNDDADGVNLYTYRSKGTYGSESAVDPDCILLDLRAHGHDGTDYLDAGGMQIVVHDTVASNSMYSQIRFNVAHDDTSSTNVMIIGSVASAPENARVKIGYRCSQTGDATTPLTIRDDDVTGQGQVTIVDRAVASTDNTCIAAMSGFGNDISGTTGRLWYLGSNSSSNQDIAFHSYLGNMTIGTANQHNLEFYIDGAVKSYFDTGGRLAIGAGVTPLALFHVEGVGTNIITTGEVVGYFKQTTASTHSAIAVDALAGQDASVYLAQAGSLKWHLRMDDAGSTYEFELRNDSNTTHFRVKQGGEVYFPAVYSDTVTSSRDLEIQSDGQIGYVSSCLASKTNIKTVSSANWIYDIRAVTYESKKPCGESDCIEKFGFIAEEIDEVLKTNNVPNSFIYKNDDEVVGINYKTMIVPLLKAVQDQKALIDNLEARLSAIEEQQQG
jgi:hypothetical protein